MAFPKSNMKMFLLQIEILPQRGGIDLPNMLHKFDTYMRDYKTAARAVTRFVYKFKVSGESKVLSVVQVLNIIGLERTLAGLSRLGNIKIECQPIMNFETFARSIQVADQLTKLNTGSLCKEGLYWLQFDIDYHGKTTDEFIAMWKKEAETILTARHKEGTSVELYKCVAMRKAHVFINATDAEQVDFLSLKLPLMQENGANVQLTCKSLQFLEDYTNLINCATELM